MPRGTPAFEVGKISRKKPLRITNTKFSVPVPFLGKEVGFSVYITLPRWAGARSPFSPSISTSTLDWGWAFRLRLRGCLVGALPKLFVDDIIALFSVIVKWLI